MNAHELGRMLLAGPDTEVALRIGYTQAHIDEVIAPGGELDPHAIGPWILDSADGEGCS